MIGSAVRGILRAMAYETELVRKARDGDRRAFDRLVELHLPQVWATVWRVLRHHEDTEDVVQEVFVTAHRALSGFRGDAKLSTWIFRISKNHCINRLKYLKRRGRGRSDNYAEANELAINDSVGAPVKPDEVLEASREREWVHRAIAELAEDQRMLVALRDIEGLSYEEIVEITELPEGTVKSRLHRAREKLAGILERLEAEAVHRGE